MFIKRRLLKLLRKSSLKYDITERYQGKLAGNFFVALHFEVNKTDFDC